jgi:OOP family OmpA-OmpF porin
MMNKKLLVQSLLSIIAFLFLFGCAVKEPAQTPSYAATQFDTEMYNSKVDNFVVVFDASSSMRHSYKGTPKFDIAKELGYRLNLTIPEMGQTAGVRSFGHDPAVSKQLTELLYGMETYSTANAEGTMDKITKPGGWSPLGTALDAVGTDLEGLSGSRNVVIIISDGMDMEKKLPMVQNLKDKFGSSICFYPIQVGNAPEGKTFLQQVSNIGGCGFFSTADDLMMGDGIANFVEKVFLAKKAAVAERKDSDGDGVYDDEDQCPGTPTGAKVNAVGCWTLDNLLFDFDKAEIKSAGYPRLDAIIGIMEKNPTMSVELQGHTDNVGTEAYNMDLSMRRSNSVAAYLVEKGIARNRLATTGFGFKSPVALNGTTFGRSLNRRVELHPY